MAPISGLATPLDLGDLPDPGFAWVAELTPTGLRYWRSLWAETCRSLDRDGSRWTLASGFDGGFQNRGG
jgi:hypothetical protein